MNYKAANTQKFQALFILPKCFKYAIGTVNSKLVSSHPTIFYCQRAAIIISNEYRPLLSIQMYYRQPLLDIHYMILIKMCIWRAEHNGHDLERLTNSCKFVLFEIIHWIWIINTITSCISISLIVVILSHKKNIIFIYSLKFLAIDWSSESPP